jgi:hypothetical protein
VGAVVVTGSHGGVYAACLARKAGLPRGDLQRCRGRARRAGIGGLAWLDAHGMAAAAVDHRSADIGNAAAMLARGTVSHANAGARALGVPGHGLRRGGTAAQRRRAPRGTVEPIAEARRELEPEGARRRLVLIDSAALVVPSDAGQVVVTGSHGLCSAAIRRTR